MQAETCVVHECDLEKVKAMGLTFLRYTRPVDQFDRISMIRQDRYRYVWVRDKEGKEFAFFIPMDKDVEQRSCKLSMSRSMTCLQSSLIRVVQVPWYPTWLSIAFSMR